MQPYVRTNHFIRATIIGGPYYMQARAKVNHAFSTNRRIDPSSPIQPAVLHKQAPPASLALLAAGHETLNKDHFPYSITLTA